MDASVLELLRCGAGHPPAPFVAAVSRRAGAMLLDAVLGCPTCGDRRVVSDGGVRFGDDVPPVGGAEPADEDDVLRLAALLDLGTPGGVVALAPVWTGLTAALARLAGVSVLALGEAAGGTDGVSPLRGMRLPPLAPGGLRGAALDAWAAAPPLAERWVAAVRPGGRLVAGLAVPVPSGVRELVRDDRHWVGTREAAPTAPVPLARRGGGAATPAG